MNIIAVTGAGGGSGITTVAAQLATALIMHDQQCVAIDASPRNALRLHFGMHWEDRTGLAPQVLAELPWNESAFRSPGGVDFLPFGHCGAREFDDWLEDRPDWFVERISEIDAPDGAFSVCDCPPQGGPFRFQILSGADLVLVVLAPDALSYATAEATRQEVLSLGARKASFLLNKFDSKHMLDRDIESLMHNDFKGDFLPILVHQDESVREAFANKQTVFDYAPSCQAASDFSALAVWLIAHFSDRRREAA